MTAETRLREEKKRNYITLTVIKPDRQRKKGSRSAQVNRRNSTSPSPDHPQNPSFPPRYCGKTRFWRKNGEKAEIDSKKARKERFGWRKMILIPLVRALEKVLTEPCGEQKGGN